MTSKKILIADDNRDLVRVLMIRCRGLGLETVAAYDAMTALTKIREQRPDLICLDVNMPAGNGLSVCEMLANDEEFSSTPVIILTGRADDDTIQRCGTMRAYYVFKSTDTWRRIEPVIRELLDLHPRASAAAETCAKTAREPSEVSPPRTDMNQWRETMVREVVFAQVAQELDDSESIGDVHET